MHPCEVDLSKEGVLAQYMMVATVLGKQYVAALREQAKRQEVEFPAV